MSTDSGPTGPGPTGPGPTGPNPRSNPLRELATYGQAPWLDTIDRRLLRDGVLARLIADDGIKGLTSNPTIFEKAIAGSDDYDDDILRLAGEGRSVQEIYEALAIADIQAAADLLAPVYEATGRVDGWACIEVRPSLARDPEATVEEARRLRAAAARDNVMIKVPGTVEGRQAIRTLISEGCPVNATLVFSPAHYVGVAHAYEEGLLALRAAGGDLASVGSVASLFVSRADTLIDKRLEALAEGATGAEADLARSLAGKIAVAGAKIVYQRFKREVAGAGMQELRREGARVQRPLWASTSTKNPAYPDTLYVDSLIGPDTVNTLPMATIRAFRDHGSVRPTLEEDVEGAQARLAQLAELGISYEDACEELQEEGIRLFRESFDGLMAAIDEKRARLTA